MSAANEFLVYGAPSGHEAQQEHLLLGGADGGLSMFHCETYCGR